MNGLPIKGLISKDFYQKDLSKVFCKYKTFKMTSTYTGPMEGILYTENNKRSSNHRRPINVRQSIEDQ